MWVIKLGGSLLKAPELKYWLELVAKFGDGEVLIVPGGGLFADTVREAQKISQVSDAVAHRMALLAMDQYGILLGGICPSLVMARSELEISERGWQHRGIVWLPSEMVLADETIPKNWQVTSDSLAAWLANKVGAKKLLLVKSKPLSKYQEPSASTLQALLDDEVVDAQFSSFIANKPFQTWLLNKADYEIFQTGFGSDILVERGVKIVKH